MYAQYVVMYMTLKQVIRITESHLEQLSKICLKTGLARFAALERICSRLNRIQQVIRHLPVLHKTSERGVFRSKSEYPFFIRKEQKCTK